MDLSHALLELAPGAIWEEENDDYNTLRWYSPQIPKPTIGQVKAKIEELKERQSWVFLRQERDRLLAESDWTQMPDVPEATKTAWQAYRQALRDLPANTTSPVIDGNERCFVSGVTWPTKP